MKTITEYRPMIFSQLAVRAEHASRHRRRLGIDLFAAVGYGSLGLWLSCDTGFAPWQWQFWLMFAPLFIAGELAWRAWAGKFIYCHPERSEAELKDLQYPSSSFAPAANFASALGRNGFEERH